MEVYLGTRAVDSTVYLSFPTLDATGANVAPLSAFEAADIRIYKNNSDVQRTSSNGITMTSPFDSLTGFHMITIDLSDNTHAGFYSAGGFYHVVLTPDETVSGVTITARTLAYFDIGAAPANVVQVNDVTVDGVGTEGDPWGPA